MVVPTSAGNFRDTVYRFTQWFEKIGRLYSTSQNSPYFINHSQFHQPFLSLSHGFRQEVPRAQKLRPASTQRQVLSKGGLNCSVFNCLCFACSGQEFFLPRLTSFFFRFTRRKALCQLPGYGRHGSVGVKNPLFTVFNRSALFAFNLSSSGRTSLFTRTL